jgi:Hint domain
LDAQRTRRNIMKMGAIVVPAMLARVNPAAAGQGGNGQGGNGQGGNGQGGNGQGGNGQGGNGQGGNGQGGNGQCFLKGTKILTAEGERQIEDLAIGDLLPTIFGGLRPIQWIGRYPFKKNDPSKPWVKDALPVRIARSALGPDVPHSDLYVTAAHSLLIDGVLVPAEALINGATITRYEAREYDDLEFFHIKLESHDVVYAEGAPAETLLNVEESAVNFAEYLRRYGTPTTQEARCAPIVNIFGGRGELKSRFRSALSPWIDLRNQADVVRDQLEERGFVDPRQFESSASRLGDSLVVERRGLDQPQDDIAVALARTSHCAQPVHHRPVEPDQPPTMLVGLVLEADVAERESPDDGLEGLLRYRDADHVPARCDFRTPACRHRRRRAICRSSPFTRRWGGIVEG